MEFLQDLLPLIGVVIGGGLSGIGAWWKARTERKRAIAIALADLLEIRTQAAAIELTITEARQRFDVPVDVAMFIRMVFGETFPLDQALHKRYEDSVSLIAGIDPVLAFRLRSKNNLPHFVSSITSLGAAAGMSAPDIASLDATLRDTLLPSLNEAISELARQHSFRTKRKVGKLLTRQQSLPPPIVGLFDLIQMNPGAQQQREAGV